MSYPEKANLAEGFKGPVEFTIEINLAITVTLTVILGFVKSLGKAAVYKNIPVYYPNHVGSVGWLE